LENYIAEVVGCWKTTAVASASVLSKRFPKLAPALVARIIGYCAQNVSRAEFVAWARAIGMPHMESTLQYQLRRHTAMWLAGQLPLRRSADLAKMPPVIRDAEPPENVVVQWLSVAKLLINLAVIRAVKPDLSADKEKPGDDVLRAVFGRFKDAAAGGTGSAA
jgi:hypothetical protein